MKGVILLDLLILFHNLIVSNPEFPFSNKESTYFEL